MGSIGKSRDIIGNDKCANQQCSFTAPHKCHCEMSLPTRYKKRSPNGKITDSVKSERLLTRRRRHHRHHSANRLQHEPPRYTIRIVLKNLGHRGRAFPAPRTGYRFRHCKTSHLTENRTRCKAAEIRTTVLSRFRAFRARTNSGWLFFFIMRSGHAVKRKSRHKPAPVSVRWIGDVSDAPRLNARRRRQDPRRRPAGVSSGSPTSGGS